MFLPLVSVSGKVSDFRNIEKIDSSGEYRINYGSWRKTTGTVRNGDKVQVRHSQEKWIPMNRIITTLVISDQRDDLISSIGSNTNERLTDIQPFSFGNETGRISTLVESPIIYPEGTKDGGVFVHVSMSSPNGEYRYNSGPGRNWSEWLSLKTSWLYMTSGIQIRLKSPSVYGESITAKINVSGREGIFTVTAGNRPKYFDFTDINDVPMSQIQISNEIRISGITGSIEVSVEKGSYSVNGTAFTSKQGMVKNGDRIRLRHTSARTLAAETNTTLTIGGVSDTFSSKTSYPESGLSSPDDFNFQSKIGVECGKHIISDKIIITVLYEGEKSVATVKNGILGHIIRAYSHEENSNIVSSIMNKEVCRALPNFESWDGFGCTTLTYKFVELTKPYILQNGSVVQLRILSSNQPNTTASASLKVGIKSATFSVTTK